nr:classical arabinogalactan protein 9-like [Arachis hypogaea]
MDAYNDTYAFHINHIPGQKLWKKSLYKKPQTPKFKKMPGTPKKKRRKEVDEGPVGGKKQKITKMKRVYKEGSCRHCGGKGHNKSNCAKKKADDEAAAVAAVAAAAPSEANTGNQQQPLPAAPEVPDEGNATEIEVGMSQPMVSKNENEESHQVNQPQARPPKLPQKRRQPPPPAIASIPPAATSAPPLTVSNASPPATVPISNTPPPTSVCIDPMVGASVATASRLRNAMRFVPTPGFKPPRKFNK